MEDFNRDDFLEAVRHGVREFREAYRLAPDHPMVVHPPGSPEADRALREEESALAAEDIFVDWSDE